jgi:hypothetical protein
LITGKGAHGETGNRDCGPRHNDKRRNIPTAELELVTDEADKSSIRLAHERRNRDPDHPAPRPSRGWRRVDDL